MLHQRTDLFLLTLTPSPLPTHPGANHSAVQPPFPLKSGAATNALASLDQRPAAAFHIRAAPRPPRDVQLPAHLHSSGRSGQSVSTASHRIATRTDATDLLPHTPSRVTGDRCRADFHLDGSLLLCLDVELILTLVFSLSHRPELTTAPEAIQPDGFSHHRRLLFFNLDLDHHHPHRDIKSRVLISSPPSPSPRTSPLRPAPISCVSFSHDLLGRQRSCCPQPQWQRLPEHQQPKRYACCRLRHDGPLGFYEQSWRRPVQPGAICPGAGSSSSPGADDGHAERPDAQRVAVLCQPDVPDKSRHPLQAAPSERGQHRRVAATKPGHATDVTRRHATTGQLSELSARWHATARVGAALSIPAFTAKWICERDALAYHGQQPNATR